MKRFSTAIILAVGLATSAHAATLATPVLATDPQYIACTAANPSSTKTVVVRSITIETASGPDVLATNVSLPPGAFVADPSVDKSGFCKFDVKGSKTSVRAAGCAQVSGTAIAGCISAQ